MQKVFVLKLKLVLDEFYESQPYKAGKIHANCENDPYHEMKERLIQLTEKFESPPFTIQRLCELITNSRKNYTKCEKFMRALEKNLMVVTSWNYPTRKNSDATEQLNGAFEIRSSFGTTDRPWAALPHSPITTSPPSILPPLQPAPQNISNQVAEEKPEELKNSDDTGAASSSTSADIDTVEGNTGESASSEIQQLPEDAPLTETDLSGNPQESSSGNEDGDATETPEQTVMAGDTTSVSLTNTEKDALKEPLPGVGTLVEKHSVKSNVPVSETPSSPYEMPSHLPEKAEVFPSASPKRKLEKEEVPMEVGSPNAKRLKSDSDVPMPSTEEADA